MTNIQTYQPLAEFAITALHGERNIRITFDGPVKILVAENGFGKTTILNSLHGLLFGNYDKLRTTQFNTISLRFKSGKSVNLEKSDFSLAFDKSPQSGMLQHFKSFLTTEQLANLYGDYRRLLRAGIKNSPHFSFARQEMQKRYANQLPDENLIQWLDILVNELGNISLYNDKLQDARNIIHDEFQFDPIYLPTYRRIEEDLRNLTGVPAGIEIDKNVIQFGMSDVQASFNRITAEIKNSSIEWFAKVNGQMLGQLIKGIELAEDMKSGLGDKDALKIVLERIGDNMPPQDKAQILALIESGEIFTEHDALAYFLANLVKVYEQQKVNDNAIKQFTEKSNRYLVDKKVVYDESAVEISIKRRKNDHPVSISSLSSGEKQIISLFSRLFLEKSKQVAIFFDEPELSLSIEWQKQLLPDIVQSGLCGFLFCTTHSPFIFDNDLAQFTVGLDKYIEEL